MEQEINKNNFLEYGEHNGNLYGTHIQSIKDVINNGRMCVLDCAPNALKILHNSQDLMPFVIFIGAPGMEQLKSIYAERRATGSNKNLTVGSGKRRYLNEIYNNELRFVGLCFSLIAKVPYVLVLDVPVHWNHWHPYMRYVFA